MTTTDSILWACVGGLIPDILRLVKARYDDAPKYIKSAFFWLSLALLVAVAGLTSYLLTPNRIIDAVAIGFSAPQMLSTALGQKHPAQSKEADKKPGKTTKTKTDESGSSISGLTEKLDGDDLRAFVNEMASPTEKLMLWWGGFRF